MAYLLLWSQPVGFMATIHPVSWIHENQIVRKCFHTWRGAGTLQGALLERICSISRQKLTVAPEGNLVSGMSCFRNIRKVVALAADIEPDRRMRLQAGKDLYHNVFRGRFFLVPFVYSWLEFSALCWGFCVCCIHSLCAARVLMPATQTLCRSGLFLQVFKITATVTCSIISLPTKHHKLYTVCSISFFRN